MTEQQINEKKLSDIISYISRIKSDNPITESIKILADKINGKNISKEELEKNKIIQNHKEVLSNSPLLEALEEFIFNKSSDDE